MPWISIMESLIASSYAVSKTVEQPRKTYRLSSCLNRAERAMAEGCNVKVVHLPIGPLPRDVLFALDIGGSLAKLVYTPQSPNDPAAASSSAMNGSEAADAEHNVPVHMVTFDTERLDDCLSYIQHHVLAPANVAAANRRNHSVTPGKTPRVRVFATGVGCMKYREHIANTLQVELDSDCEEMGHAALGLDFLWRYLPPQKLLHQESELGNFNFKCPLGESGVAPCLLVNLGSALTIVQIDADGSMKGIVGGSAQGGLTFLGLGALLTQAKSFEELLELAERGDRRNLDLVVKDTAGAAYNLLPGDGMVSSFGKAAKQNSRQNQGTSFREEDVASSLLYLITDQLIQTTYLVAKCQGVNRAVFCGSFLSSNQTIIQQIKHKLQKCSLFLQFNVTPVFCNYENYLGAIGTFASHIKNSPPSSPNSSHTDHS